jgi:hypothetical protein
VFHESLVEISGTVRVHQEGSEGTKLSRGGIGKIEEA